MGFRKETMWIKGFLDALLLQENVELRQLKVLSKKLETIIKEIESKYQENDPVIGNLNNVASDDDLPF